MPPFCKRGVPNRLEYSDASVVDQCANAPKSGFDLADCIVDLQGIRHISVRCNDLARLVQQSGCSGQRFEVDAQECSPVAVRQKPLTNGQANAASTTRNDGGWERY